MTIQALYPVTRDKVFREVFNSYNSVVKNKGTFAGSVGISNGKADTERVGSDGVSYKKPLVGTYSIVAKVEVEDYNTSGQYIADYRNDGGSNFIQIDTGGALTGGGTFYINGVASSTLTANGTYHIVQTGVSLSLDTLWLLRRYTIANTSFEGKTHYIDIYKGTLSAEEVSALYKKSLYQRPSINGQIFSLDPRKGVIEDRYGLSFVDTNVDVLKSLSRAMNFDGSTSKLVNSTANYRSSDSSGTIMFWGKSRITGAGQFALASADEATFDFQFGVGVSSTNRVAVFQNNDDISTQVTGTNTFTVDKWHHFAISSNGSSYKLYMDGKEETKITITGTDNGDWFADTSNRDNVTIGILKRNTESAPWNGQLSMINVNSQQLTDEEIAREYNATKRFFNV